MPRLRPDGGRIKINFKAKIDESIILPTVDDVGKSKMNARQKKAYVEKLLEDFDQKSERRTDSDDVTLHC